MDIILEEFERLHDFFKGIVFDKWIPCSCDICKKMNWKGKHYFKYEMLQRAYSKNVEAVQCRQSFEPINVYKLIHDTLIAKNMDDFYNNKKRLEEIAIRQNHSDSGKNIPGNKIVHNYYGADEKPVPSVFDFEKTTRQPIDKTAFKAIFAQGHFDQIIDSFPKYTDDTILQKEILKLKQRWKKK